VVHIQHFSQRSGETPSQSESTRPRCVCSRQNSFNYAKKTDKRRERKPKPIHCARTEDVVSAIDVINVEMKIKKKTLKREENVEKIKRNVCKRWIKNVADICHESNYYLCTLSHMQVVKLPNLYDFSALQQVSKIFCSIGYVHR